MGYYYRLYFNHLRLIWLPEGLGLAEEEAGEAAPDEEGIAKSIEILHGGRGESGGGGKGDGAAFRPAADGAAEVEFGVEAATAGEDEAAEGSEEGVGFIHFVFEAGDVARGDDGLAGAEVFGFGGEERAEVEELVLDAGEAGGEEAEAGNAIGDGRDGEADGGVQFVDGAIGFDAESILGNALATDEAGLALVAGAGVDAGEGDVGFVEAIRGAHRIHCR